MPPDNFADRIGQRHALIRDSLGVDIECIEQRDVAMVRLVLPYRDRQAEVDSGERPGTTTEDRKKIADLEREVRELRRANEILKAASAYFGEGIISGCTNT